MNRVLALAGGLLALGAIANAQTSVVYFSDPSGLSARAKFEVVNGGNSLRITLCNTTTAVPGSFTSSDQLLSSLSFDLGVPGLNIGDANITSGTVRTGSSSYSVNFSLVAVGPDTDVSGEYGYGNSGGPTLLPNFFSTLDGGAVPFGGANLHEDPTLGDAEAGLIPLVPPIALSGEGAIQDEIVIELNLDVVISDLGFLAQGGLLAGFGSGISFLRNDCDHDSRTMTTPDPGGFNAPNSLFAMGIPSIGNPNYKVCMDEAANACGITPGSVTVVAFSSQTTSLLLPGFGCVAGNPGELMIDLTIPFMVLGPVAWSGPGSPACHPLPIPADPSLCRSVCHGQGLWLDRGGATRRFILTNRLSNVIGI